jgi:uncharacterized membrane protein (DUF485 family)
MENASPSDHREDRMDRLATRRSRVQYAASFAVALLYFGFMALFAFDQALLGRVLVPGLTLSILLGFLVIVGSCTVSLLYVAWLNRIHDRQQRALIGRRRS